MVDGNAGDTVAGTIMVDGNAGDTVAEAIMVYENAGDTVAGAIMVYGNAGDTVAGTLWTEAAPPEPLFPRWRPFPPWVTPPSKNTESPTQPHQLCRGFFFDVWADTGAHPYDRNGSVTSRSPYERNHPSR